MNGEDRNALIEAALAWADAGVPVFPVRRDKRPATTRGHKDASTDAAAVRKMFETARNLGGIGAAMGRASGLFAIDADTYKPDTGEAARAFIASLEKRDLLPETLVHATQNGGRHYIYWSDKAWPNCKPSKGVEVKGEGGYIIVPPSPGYSAEVDWEIAEAPAGLLQLLAASKVEAANMTLDQLRADILSGESYHDALTQLAAKLGASSKSQVEIQAELMQLMQTSAGSVSGHPAHDRWRRVMEGTELPRIARSGYLKFHPNAADDELGQLIMQDAASSTAIAKMFRHAPTGETVTPEKEDGEDDDEEWPPANCYLGGLVDLQALLDRKYSAYPLFAMGETSILSAQPKAGKSVLATTFALHIAAGMNITHPDGSVLVKIAEPMPVYYAAIEGQGATMARIKAWLLKTEFDKNTEEEKAKFPLLVRNGTLNLLSEKSQDAFVIDVLRSQIEWTKEKNGGYSGYGLLVIDTMTQAMPGGDQNSVDDTSLFFNFIRKIRDAGIDAPILIIHHDSRGTQRVRGSSNIEAEPDNLYGLEKDDASGFIKFTIRMARGMDQVFNLMFTMEPVDLGVTTQGYSLSAPWLRIGDPDTDSAEAIRRAAGVYTGRDMVDDDICQHIIKVFKGKLAKLERPERGLILHAPEVVSELQKFEPCYWAHLDTRSIEFFDAVARTLKYSNDQTKNGYDDGKFWVGMTELGGVKNVVSSFVLQKSADRAKLLTVVAGRKTAAPAGATPLRPTTR